MLCLSALLAHSNAMPEVYRQDRGYGTRNLVSRDGRESCRGPDGCGTTLVSPAPHTTTVDPMGHAQETDRSVEAVARSLKSGGSRWSRRDHGRAAAQRAFLEEILEVVPVHAYDRVVANHHGALLAHVQRTGGTRGAHDLIIAATARTADPNPVNCSVTPPLRPQERFVQQSDGRGGGRRPSLPAGQPPGTGRGLGLPTANARTRPVRPPALSGRCRGRSAPGPVWRRSRGGAGRTGPRCWPAASSGCTAWC